jgi:hypothetical protein
MVALRTSTGHHAGRRLETSLVNELVLAAVVNLTVVAGENLTVGSTTKLPAASVAPGR